MIYGDPIILGGGGSGGPTAQDAILLATVPAGSTVTATKSGVTVTPTLWVSAADSSLEAALFVFAPAQFDSVNPWTITATAGTSTASTTVLITTNKEYAVAISYHVPPEYQEVEYIETTGTQWINTGISANTANLRTISTVLVTSVSVADGDSIWSGSWDVSGYLLNVNASGELGWHSGGKKVTANITLNNWFSVETTKQNLVVDGTSYALASPSGSDSNTIVLIAWCSSGARGGRARARYKATMMYSGTTLLREFYPCYRKSDSVAGFWDKANEVFYTNAGTGTFVVGPDL